MEVFDPADGSMTTVSETAQPRRSFVTATVVGDRRVLVAGGYDDEVTPTAVGPHRDGSRSLTSTGATAWCPREDSNLRLTV